MLTINEFSAHNRANESKFSIIFDSKVRQGEKNDKKNSINAVY